MDQASSQGHDDYRREAMGAFAHEIRTPLTALRMVVELARRQGEDGNLVLDSDLATMLGRSIADLEQLADDLQDQSRLERGKVALATEPCDLAGAVEAAQALLQRSVQLSVELPCSVSGPWDRIRLTKALAAFAAGANRLGDGSGEVTVRMEVSPDEVTLRFESGSAGGESRPIGADAGFAFFHAREYLLAAGGRVEVERGERGATICVLLPRTEAQRGAH